mgnify:CR=1 FL=1
MTRKAAMTVDTELAPEACNSSPGNANLRIGTQAGHDEGSHSNPLRKYALRHTSQKHSPHLPLANTETGVPRLADFMF